METEPTLNKLPYRPGTPLSKIIEGGVMRDFQTSQIIEEAAAMGFQIDADLVDMVRRDFDRRLEDWARSKEPPSSRRDDLERELEEWAESIGLLPTKECDISNLSPDTEDPALLWAEIFRLRDQVQGPDGFETWQDAAVDERVRRVAAENELKKLKENASSDTVPKT